MRIGGKTVFKKFGVVVALGLMAGMTALGPMATGVAAAAASTGTVLAADGQWHALPAAQQAWYPFQYSGDGSQIEVRMATPNGGGFAVWTPQEYAQYQNGEAVTPIGRGSANELLGGDLYWTGNFNEAGTYYVIATAGNAPMDYSLTVKGSGVTLPQPQAEPATKPVTTAAAATTAPKTEQAAAQPVATAEQKSGTGPGSALSIDCKWANIGADQQLWYAIPYGGGDARVVIRMATDSNHPASFAVYTGAEVTSDSDPVGIGSADAAMGGDLVWAGGFTDAGTIYVVVSGNGVGNTGYQLALQ
jgi:hypothetical protein